ncbi:MAG: sugar transferase [Eubacteriales bacterium]|nr:sugar transferase [Eubacteriales bacterium]
MTIESRRRSAAAHLFKIVYILGVIACVNLAIIIGFYVIYDPSVPMFYVSFRDYTRTVPLLTVGVVLFIDLLGMTHFFRKTKTDLLRTATQFSLLVVLTASTIAYFFQYNAFPRYVLAFSTLSMTTLVALWSILSLVISRLIYSRGQLLIVARTPADADRLFIKAAGELRRLNLVYLGYALSGEKDNLFHQIDQSSEILVSPDLDESDKETIYLYCIDHDKTLYIVPAYSELVLSKFRVIQFSDMPTFLVDNLGLKFQQRVFKRVFDFFFSLLVLILAAPFMLVIAILIRIDSKGPAIYSQERITLSGRVHKIYKFRTMVENAEEKFGSFQSSMDDPRVTRIGRILRQSRMDELPQFFNILIGEMSVVGPRSDRPITIGAFEEQIPGYNQRLKVKSGLTGLAQISGHYDTAPEDKLRYDLMYIKNYSLLLDLAIIMKTIQVVFRGLTSGGGIFKNHGMPTHNFPAGKTPGPDRSDEKNANI